MIDHNMSRSPERFYVLITGSASGIGRCFAQHYLQQPNTTVIAVDRDISNLSATTTDTSLLTYQVDFSKSSAIQSLVHHDLVEHIPHLDLVIHSAGIRGLVPEIEARVPESVEAAETLECMDAATMLRTFEINTLGTFTFLQALLGSGLLGLSKVVVMTSRMGSISYNTAGGAYAYRASKAALNAIVKSMSIDVAKRRDGKEVVFALMHPGRVETGLTRCREDGAITAEESVVEMLKVMETLKVEDSGRFIDRFGMDIGW